MIRRIALLALAAAFVMAGDASKSFKASPEYSSGKKGPLMESLGCYALMEPHKKVDWAFHAAGFDAWSLRGEQVTVFAFDSEGKKLVPTPNAPSGQWVFGIYNGFQGIQPVPRMTWADGTDFPSSSMDPFTMGIARQQPGVFNGMLEIRSKLTPGEAEAEKAVFEQEKASLGEEEAKKRAEGRTNALKAAEEARLRAELQIPPKPGDAELLKAAKARQENNRALALKETRAPEARPGWNLVIYLAEAESTGVGPFRKAHIVGEMVLLKDGKPMMAVRHRSMDVLVGGALVLRNGQALGGAIFPSRLD